MFRLLMTMSKLTFTNYGKPINYTYSTLKKLIGVTLLYNTKEFLERMKKEEKCFDMFVKHIFTTMTLYRQEEIDVFYKKVKTYTS